MVHCILSAKFELCLTLGVPGKPVEQQMASDAPNGAKPTALEIDSRDVVNELNKFEEDIAQLRTMERFFNGRFFNFVLKAR